MKRPIRFLWAAASAALALCMLLGCAAGELSADTAPAATAAPAPTATEAPAAEEEALPGLEQIMDPAERVWRYTDDPVRLAAIRDDGWLAADFDDSGWLAAAGSFGANEGRLKEVAGEEPSVCLRHYLPDGRTVPVYYFRLRFTARPAEVTEPLSAEILYDDAAVVYLNGREIFSGNVPDGGYPDAGAYGCAGFYDEMPRGTVVLDGASLREGENVLCVALHQADDSSSDIFFALGAFTAGAAEQDDLRADTLCLGVGEDEGQMLVTWRGPALEGACVQVEAGDRLTDGAAVYPAARSYEEDGLCTYRAVIDGLEPGDYVYRPVDLYPGQTGHFTVTDPGEGFTFLCHGDAQIRDGDDLEATWAYQTLADHAMGGGGAQFVLSLGDQVDEAGSRAQYRRFTAAPVLKSVPLAAVLGNHETGSRAFSQAFSLPNMDAATVTDAGDMSGDYWFVRGNTLFLCLNSNNEDVEAHRQFIRQAVDSCAARYGEPVWTVAAFHFAPFSPGTHADDEAVRQTREEYPAMLAEAGVDVVFSGHDHIYARSWPMDGQEPVRDGGEGIVYFTLGSATGSKFYDISEGTFDYVAFADGERWPAMSRVDVTDSSFTVTTYQLRGNDILLLDSYRIDRP